MTFISQKSEDIHHPDQFLRRKQQSLDTKKKYLRTVKKHVQGGDYDVKDAIMIAQDELTTLFPKVNNILTNAEDQQKVVGAADRLLAGLQAFETVFEKRLEDNDVEALSDEQLQTFINSLNEEYAEQLK